MATVMTWDGKRFDYMPRTQAERAQGRGELQIASGLSPENLMTAAELQELRELRRKQKETREMNARRRGKKYKTKGEISENQGD